MSFRSSTPVSLKAREVLILGQMPSYEERLHQMETVLKNSVTDNYYGEQHDSTLRFVGPFIWLIRNSLEQDPVCGGSERTQRFEVHRIRCASFILRSRGPYGSARSVPTCMPCNSPTYIRYSKRPLRFTLDVHTKHIPYFPSTTKKAILQMEARCRRL